MKVKKIALAAALFSLGILSLGLQAVPVSADCTYTCACFSPGNPDPNDCGPGQDETCETNTCLCPGSCNTDPCEDDPDPCCGSEDPCCGSIDPCCGSEDPCCGLEGQDLACCQDPNAEGCGGEDCAGVPKPDGDYTCCAGSWYPTDSQKTCCGGEEYCDICDGTGPNSADCCRAREECDEDDQCTTYDESCLVGVVDSCDDTDPDACCNPCQVGNRCYDPDANCGGDVTECSYTYTAPGLEGCDGAVYPPEGLSVTLNMTVSGTVCPDPEFFAEAAQVALAEAALRVQLPLDSNGDGICDCAEGTTLCDGECVEECCPDGSIPDPVYGCTVCGPGEIPCNGACIPDTEVCCPAGTYFDPALNQCVTCGAGQRYCPLQRRCILETQCCDPDNFQYCLNRQECIPKTECCDPTYVACPTCRPAAECVDMCLGQATGGEYCAEVVAEGGATNSPWAAVYPTDLALGGFFQQRPGGQTFAQAKSSQAAARTDGDPATVEMPLVGRVVTLAGGGSCTAQICDHGQECALYVRAGGRTSATCVDTICDVCDPESVCFSEEACGCNPLVDPVSCCEADPGKPGYNPECVLPPRGVAIEVLPNLINKGGSCVVLWASQGMASTTVVGEGMDAGPNLDLRHLSAGIATVSNVQTSTLFKIVGRGVDGKTYEATDLCATNPSIGEF